MFAFRKYCCLLLALVILAPCAVAVNQANDRSLSLTIGKSVIIDSDADIVRVTVGAATVAEAIAINLREILVNGLTPGETTLIIWENGGARLVYNVTVEPSSAKLTAVRKQLAIEVGGVTVDFDNETAFLRGTVKDTVTAERAATIAGTLGKVVNLLHVTVPPASAQILLKVRFANVDRSSSKQLGVDLMSSGHITSAGATSTGQITLSDALNLLVFRKTFNISATLTALQSKNLLEILAEPNLLVIDGQSASFVSGGEFPYPIVQGGSTSGAVTIAFREFGVKIKFLPNLTPRGTIRLHVAPEVSSLDFANGLLFQGFHIPALVTRKVDTEVELASGQSFVIAGLLDNRITETLSQVPGIGSIPILGQLFRSKTFTTSNSELLIIITPELVTPIPVGAPVPDLVRPTEFLKGGALDSVRNPTYEIAGPSPFGPRGTVPVEQLLKSKEGPQSVNPATPQLLPQLPVAVPAPVKNADGG